MGYNDQYLVERDTHLHPKSLVCTFARQVLMERICQEKYSRKN